MLYKNPFANNAVLSIPKQASYQSSTISGSMVLASQNIASNVFYLYNTTTSSKVVFAEAVARQGFALDGAIGDKLHESKTAGKEFAASNLYSRQTTSTCLTGKPQKNKEVLVTDTSVGEVERKHVLLVKWSHFFYKIPKKNLLEMNTVVIGKNTS